MFLFALQEYLEIVILLITLLNENINKNELNKNTTKITLV